MECMRQVKEDKQEISLEELREGFKQWDESTSPSPLGRHLGIYKRLTDKIEQRNEKTHLLEVMKGIDNIAFSRGLAIKRWCKVHNVLLVKDTKNPRLHILRTIHIIEADYHLATKTLWERRTMRSANKGKFLSDSN